MLTAFLERSAVKRDSYGGWLTVVAFAEKIRRGRRDGRAGYMWQGSGGAGGRGSSDKPTGPRCAGNTFVAGEFVTSRDFYFFFKVYMPAN